MDKIRIQNMKFFTYNGVLKEEKILGQPIEVDIEMSLSLEKAGKSDDVQDTVNYAEIYQLIENEVTSHYYDLIEAVSSAVLDKIEEGYKEQLSGVVIRLRKYSVPMKGIYDYVEVEMERKFK